MWETMLTGQCHLPKLKLCVLKAQGPTPGDTTSPEGHGCSLEAFLEQGELIYVHFLLSMFSKKQYLDATHTRHYLKRKV